MRRIRVALLAVAIALGVPVALLAWRALDGLAVERAVRHQAVAERAFDEMERVLSRFLEGEELRPFEHYREVLSDGTPSPLSRPSPQPFVVGAFQVDPDGSLHVPLRPGDGETREAVQIVRRLAGEMFVAGEPVARMGAKLSANAAPAAIPAPGTTRPLEGRLAKKREAARKDERKEQDDDTAYTLLQNLNRAAGSRLERRRKVVEAQSRKQGRESPAAQLAFAEAEGFADAKEPLAESASRDALGSVKRDLASGRPAAPPARTPESAAPASRQADLVSEVGVMLEPMLGRAAGADHLLLYRTVLRGQQGFRQGLVLDRRALGAWLDTEVLESSGLARYARVSFEPDATLSGGGDSFQHGFAEPFDALSARMRLAGLPGASGPGVVHALVALLVVVGAAGLFAIHRMVGVVVQFAERRSNFVAAVTHELKTPLTAIRMYGEMLRDGMVRDEGKRDEYYGTITDESERLSRLIDNVLEFSRLERGAREMNWTVGALAPILEDVALRLGAHARREGFALETAIQPNLPTVRYDRDALVQVLFNLVDNAMKYASAADDRRIVLEARRGDQGVVVAVRDFGPGVPTRHVSRIFEPFYRGGEELTRTTKGTGIGLALVKELAERMDAVVAGGNASGGGFRVMLTFASA